MFDALTNTWSLRAFGPLLQAHSSLIGRKMPCGALISLMAAPKGAIRKMRLILWHFPSALIGRWACA